MLVLITVIHVILYLGHDRIDVGENALCFTFALEVVLELARSLLLRGFQIDLLDFAEASLEVNSLDLLLGEVAVFSLTLLAVDFSVLILF